MLEMLLAATLGVHSLQDPDAPKASEVYEAPATKADLTRHALGCISQHATSGFLSIPTIQSSDAEVGAVVAVNHFGGEGLFGRDVRTTLTFEARDGRFRITHSNIQFFTELGWEWEPLRRSGGLWANTERRLDQQNAEIGTCIRTAVEASDW